MGTEGVELAELAGSKWMVEFQLAMRDWRLEIWRKHAMFTVMVWVIFSGYRLRSIGSHGRLGHPGPLWLPAVTGLHQRNTQFILLCIVGLHVVDLGPLYTRNCWELDLLFCGPQGNELSGIPWLVIPAPLFSIVFLLISDFEHGHYTLAQIIESFGWKLVNFKYQSPVNCKFKLSMWTVV